MSTTTGSTSTTIHDTGTESTYVEQTPKKKSIKHELKFCVAWIEIFQSGEGYLVHEQKKKRPYNAQHSNKQEWYRSALPTLNGNYKKIQK
jgi:hypothetical protein